MSLHDSTIGRAVKSPVTIASGSVAMLWAFISSVLNATGIADEWRTVIESAYVFMAAGGILWLRDAFRRVFGYETRSNDRLGKFKG